MSDDAASDQRSRAALEAIVFGRPGSASEAEVDAAASELARRLEAERPPSPVLELEPELESDLEPHPEGAVLRTDDSDPDADPRPRPTRRRIAITALAVILALAFVAGAVQLRALTTTDSMSIFDRPQTEADLAIQPRLTDPAIRYESVRYAGAAEGYQVYVYRTIANELSPARLSLACMVVTQNEQSTRGSCSSPTEFSTAGAVIRFETEVGWTEVGWRIREGVTVTSGEYPPALSIFDEPQDAVDRAALVFIPELRVDLQPSARYLGTGAGYAFVVYRGDDTDVCLAAYVPSATQLNSESSCVDQEIFERDGISLAYPGAEPMIQVRWGPEARFDVNGR